MQFVSVTALCVCNVLCIVRIVRVWSAEENGRKRNCPGNKYYKCNNVTALSALEICHNVYYTVHCTYLIIQIVAGAKIYSLFFYILLKNRNLFSSDFLFFFFSSAGKICTIFIGFSLVDCERDRSLRLFAHGVKQILYRMRWSRAGRAYE